MGPRRSNNPFAVNVVNKSSVGAAEVERVIAAIQKQLDQQFTPEWGVQAKLSLVGRTDGTTPTVYVLDSSGQVSVKHGSGGTTLGFHDVAVSEQPYGMVYVKDTVAAGFQWSSTMSHEMMEMILDPHANQWAGARFQNQLAYFAWECCDPVQNDVYDIDGVQVSNFILPSWFQLGGSKWDYLGNLTGPLEVDSGGDAMMFLQVGKMLSLQSEVASSESAAPSGGSATLTPVKFNDKSHLAGSRWWRRWQKVKS